MATQPSTRQIAREELQGTADQQIEGLLRVLNVFITDINTGWNNDLTMQENMDANVRTFRVTTNALYPNVDAFEEVKFSHSVKRKISGTEVLQVIDATNRDAVIYDSVYVDVNYDEPNVGKIKYIHGLPCTETAYDITILVL